MAASTEGTDLRSWFANRAAFRAQTREALEKLEECRQRLLIAVGKREPDPFVGFTDDSISGIASLTKEAVTQLWEADAELSQISSARQAAQSALQSTRQEVGWAAQQRAQKETEQASQRKYAARKRQAWIKRKALRFGAIGVLLAAFYFVVRF